MELGVPSSSFKVILRKLKERCALALAVLHFLTPTQSLTAKKLYNLNKTNAFKGTSPTQQLPKPAVVVISSLQVVQLEK